MGRLKLFDDDDESPEEDLSKIEIDHEFAKRHEHNKRREELQRYEELKKQGRVESSDSDSEESSEDEELMKPGKKTDFQFFDALIKVKTQDPILRNKDAKLFNSDSESNDDSDNECEEKEKQKKKKPMYLKDVVSKHLIEAGPEFDDEEMENEDNDEEGNRVKSYAEEQEELRGEFLKAVEEGENDDDDGDFLKVKSGSKDDEDDDDDEVGGKLDEYFGEDEKLDEDTKFLKDYFRNRMWIDNQKGNRMGDDEIEFSEDEEEIEKQEDYEREYNFRFEENAGDRVWGHARIVEGSVRKKDNARKLQRDRKEERMAQAEFQRREELKRLKNLKKQEINEKLEKIREVAGIGQDGDVFLDEDDLDEDFDPENYDKKMKDAFGDGYYDAEDVDPEFGSDQDEDDVGFEKPDFDKEDELLGLPKGWDEVNKSGEGFMSARQRILKDRVVDEDENEIVKDGDEEPKEGKRKRKRKPSDVEKAVKGQLLEEYYKLDYEDTIGDLKTRFKYKTVNPKRYGLAPEEILMMDDKELNQYISLNKLAPYREKEWKVPRIKTVQLKQKSKKLLNGDTSDLVNEDRDRKKTRRDSKEKTEVFNSVETESSQPAESNGDTSNLSRQSKRRRRQAELKLSRSRLMAYGKIPSKSKSKNQ